MQLVYKYKATTIFTGNLTSIFRGEQVHRYALFGEVITEYNAYWHQGRIPDYKFNAKELDEENGMYYYSARYYNPPTFISRDPLFEKKPWVSCYAYCANNPVNKVDPTGLYEKESQAQKAHEKAIKRYGRDNVGSIYQNAKGKYEFRISKTGFKQERGDNIPENSDAHADGGTKMSNNLKLFFYNIINGASGGYHGSADNGQRQENRKGHDETESVDWTNLISHMPGPIEFNNNRKKSLTPQTNTIEPELEQDGYIIHITNNQTGQKHPVWVKDSKDSAKMRKWWGEKWITVDTIYPHTKEK
jgi:RHS repeat-associated protein